MKCLNASDTSHRAPRTTPEICLGKFNSVLFHPTSIYQESAYTVYSSRECNCCLASWVVKMIGEWGNTLSIKGAPLFSGCIFCFLWFPKQKCNTKQGIFVTVGGGKPKKHCPCLIGLNWRAWLPGLLFWKRSCCVPASQLVVMPHDLRDSLDLLTWHSSAAVTIFCLTVKHWIVSSQKMLRS